MIKIDFLIEEENLFEWLGMLMFGKKVMSRYYHFIFSYLGPRL